jgi:adenylate kinase family enzyme
MALVIAVMGESGSGKTTSMRNLDPKTTYYIDADMKGLSWKGWKKDWNKEAKNYIQIDDPKVAIGFLGNVNDKAPQIKTVVIDTLNGLMVAEEMRRSKEKGYDKWTDIASYVWDLIQIALKCRDDLTVVFLCHSQTERDDNGNIWTRIKTSGRKLDKIVLESKFTTVLLCRTEGEKHWYETQANFSTAKSPLGALPKEMDSDIVPVIKALKEY